MKDLKEMDARRLTGRITELEHELIHLTEAVRSGKEKNHAKIGQLKRDIARALTLRHEQETAKL